MKEIKFRAYVTPLDKVLDVTTIDFGNNEILVIDEKGIDHWISYINYELLQYTGVKDRNGVEIYEGDVVNSWAGINDIYLREVVKDENEPSLDFKPKTGFTLCKNNGHLFEVIGNIYENPALATS